MPLYRLNLGCLFIRTSHVMTLVKIYICHHIYMVTFPKHPDHYITYMLYDRLHGEEQFHSKKCFLEMTPSLGKMRLKLRPQKLSF